MKEFAPATPADMLKEEVLAEHSLLQNQLARATGISQSQIAEIVNHRRQITPDTAPRLGLYFRNTPEFWLNLQTRYDLKMVRKNLVREAVAQNQSAAGSLKELSTRDTRIGLSLST